MLNSKHINNPTKSNKLKKHFNNKSNLNRRRRRFKHQSIRLISKNIGFSPQTTQPTTTRIQIIQIIRNPSPAFNQNTNMVHFKTLTNFITTKFLQRNNLWLIQQNPICFFSEFRTTHLRVPFSEGWNQIGEGFGGGIYRREREGIVDGTRERGWNRRELEETGEEEEEEGEGYHDCDGDCVEGFGWLWHYKHAAGRKKVWCGGSMSMF